MRHPRLASFQTKSTSSPSRMSGLKRREVSLVLCTSSGMADQTRLLLTTSSRGRHRANRTRPLHSFPSMSRSFPKMYNGRYIDGIASSPRVISNSLSAAAVGAGAAVAGFDCAGLSSRIRHQANKVKGRLQRAAFENGAPRPGGADDGHIQAIDEAQNKLKKPVKQWDRWCSDEPGGPSTATRGLQTRAWWEVVSPDASESNYERSNSQRLRGLNDPLSSSGLAGSGSIGISIGIPAFTW